MNKQSVKLFAKKALFVIGDVIGLAAIIAISIFILSLG
jgi:hypothetical protein